MWAFKYHHQLAVRPFWEGGGEGQNSGGGGQPKGKIRPIGWQQAIEPFQAMEPCTVLLGFAPAGTDPRRHSGAARALHRLYRRRNGACKAANASSVTRADMCPWYGAWGACHAGSALVTGRALPLQQRGF